MSVSVPVGEVREIYLKPFRDICRFATATLYEKRGYPHYDTFRKLKRKFYQVPTRNPTLLRASLIWLLAKKQNFYLTKTMLSDIFGVSTVSIHNIAKELAPLLEEAPKE